MVSVERTKGMASTHLLLRTSPSFWPLALLPLSANAERRAVWAEGDSGASNLTLLPSTELTELRCELLVPYWYSSQLVGFRLMVTTASKECKGRLDRLAEAAGWLQVRAQLRRRREENVGIKSVKQNSGVRLVD